MAWFFAVITLYLITLWDPFGLSSAMNKASANLFYRIFTGPVFAEMPLGSDDEGDVVDRFSVALLVESDLKELKQSWPTQYVIHADVLWALQELGAKGVFIDIAFLDDRRDRDESFRALLFQLQDMWDREGSRVPVFLAMPRDAAGEFQQPFNWLQTPASGSEEESWRLPDCAFVSVPGARFTREGRIYELFQIDEGGRGPIWSAALAIYGLERGWVDSVDCPNFRAWPIWQEKRPWLETEAASGDRMMEIVWAVRDFEWSDEKGTYRNNGLFPCGDTPNSLFGRLWRSVADNLVDVNERAREFELPSSLLLTCGPFDTFSVQQLLYAASSPSFADEEEEEKEAFKAFRSRIKALVHDRIVAYGAAVTAVEDRVEPPTHVPIAAAYFHAMAAANLVAYEDAYKRPSRYWGWADLPLKELLLCLLLALGILYHEIGHRIAEPARRQISARWHGDKNAVKPELGSTGGLVARVVLGTLLYLLAFVATAALLSWFAWSHLHLAPLNFVGAFTLEVGRSFVMRAFDIEIFK